LKIITELAPIDLRQTLFELPEGMKKNLYVGFSMPVVASNDILFIPSSKGKQAAARSVDVAVALASGFAFYGVYR